MKTPKPQLGLLAVLLLAGAVHAQTFPTQRVTIVVPLSAGGPTDVLARLLAQNLEQKWRQPVLVENRPGAGIMVGTTAVARAPADGHMLLFVGNAVVTTGLFVKNIDPADVDVKPVVQVARGLYLAVTNADVPAKTLRELVAQAKARPKALNYATIPNSTSELDYALFQQRAGVEMTGIPYPGNAPASIALARNDVQFYLAVPSTVAAQITAGRVVVLAATTATRSEMYPNVPTIKESGVDFEADYSLGLFAPARTPDSVVALIGADAAAAMKTPAIREKLPGMGLDAADVQGPAWNRELQGRLKVYKELADKLGIKPQ